MVTDTQRAEMLQLIRSHLPKRIDPSRVTLGPSTTSLRVLLDGQLNNDYGYGVFGWISIELSPFGGRDASSVFRAIRRAVKEHNIKDGAPE